MSSTTKVAIVTGSNKGIGFAIVRGLCKQFDGHVYLTARNESLGKAAVSELEKEGLHPKFHQLNINEEQSVVRLAQYIKSQYGGIDILVNNAGIAYKNDAVEPFSEQAEVTMRTNYWGTLTACKHLYPLLRAHARVVHVSSTMSQIAMKRCSEELQSKLRSLRTIDEISKYMSDFVKATQDDNYKALGWPNTAYGVSKIGVSLITPIQQAEFDKTSPSGNTDIVVNACCPGYVATDMSSFKGHKTIDEGADTPLYLALLPPNVTEPRGKFVSERQVQAV